jgi:pimeloyl-ACP methyl ester carboxylesterase
MEEPLRKSLIDALPNAQVKVFEGLGHNPFWEDPAGVAQIVNLVLATTPKGAAKRSGEITSND